MDFRSVSMFFGGCILPEDIRIDLESSYRSLEGRTAGCGTPDEDLFLLPQIIFYSLAGDLRKAIELLDILKLKATAAEDEDLLVRIPVYKLHLQRIETAPPPLHFWSNTSTETRVLEDARYNRGETPAFHKSLDGLTQKVDDRFKNSPRPKIEVLESETLLTIWPMAHYTWNGSYLHHPEFRSRTSAFRRKIISGGMGEFKSHHISNSKWRGMDETAFMMQLLNARKVSASGKSVPFLDTNSMETEILDNRSGNALRLLVMGDFQISKKPFTSPLALHLMLYAAGPGWNDRQWDAMEGDGNLRPPKEVETGALRLYMESFGLFKAEACHRGMGAIHLRLGCVLMMKAIDELSSDGLGDGSVTKSCQEAMEKAAIEFEKAEPLFKFDATHLCILNAHRLLCRLVQREAVDVNDAIESAQRIGRWGAESGNPWPARFSGMLFLRMGRRLASKHIKERVLGCCVVARVIFASLGDATLEAKAVEAQALYYHETGHTVLARRHLRCNQRVVQSAFEHMAGVIGSCDSTYWQKLGEFQRKRHDAFQELGSKIFGATQDAQRWHSYLKSISATEQNPVPIAKNIQQEIPSQGCLGRLERVVQNLSINHELDKAGYRDSADRMRRTWRQHQDAIRKMDSKEAEKVLHMLKNDESTEDGIRNMSSEEADKEPQMLKENEGVSNKLFDYHRFPEIPSDVVRKVVVFCYQGRFHDAREELSTSLPPIMIPDFRALAPVLAPRGPASTLVADHIHQQIQMHLWLCYISRDWRKGHNTLVNLGSSKSMFIEELRRSSDVDRWMSMVALGYIRFHTSPALLEQSLEWYAEAHRVVMSNRLNLVDIQERRTGGQLISPVDVYQGLAKIGVSLHVNKQRISPFRLFGRKFLNINYRSSQITPQNIDLALLFFEQGRASVLADMILLHDDSGRLEDWLKLRTVTDDMNEIVSEPSHGPSDHVRRTSSIAEVALQDQKILRLAFRVQRDSSFREWVVADKIYKAIPDDTVVIHINTDLEQTTILYITNQGVQLANEAALSAHDVNTIVLQYLDLFRLRKFGKEARSRPEKLIRHEQYDHLVERLSEHIVSPATALLKKMKTIVFVPSKLLHNFPVSVLNLEDAPLCESKTTYICPSLQVLSLLSRRFPKQPRPEQATKLSSPGFVTFMPRRKGIHSSDESLDVAAAFAIKNAEGLRYKAIPAYAMERRSLLDEMRTSDIVLVSSHGHVGESTPWGNKLSVGTDLFVTEMLGNTFSTKVVVLQACLSSASGLDDGDDVIGFSHAVLSSGANSFVGAVWEVNERAASLLISLFLDSYKSLHSSLTAAEALREAQMRLRLMQRAEVIRELSLVQKTMRQAMAEERFAEYKMNFKAMARSVGKEIDQIKETYTESECPFDHPFYWAPFILVGYGHVKFL